MPSKSCIYLASLDTAASTSSFPLTLVFFSMTRVNSAEAMPPISNAQVKTAVINNRKNFVLTRKRKGFFFSSALTQFPPKPGGANRPVCFYYSGVICYFK